jgi:hypothetical protein
MNATYERNPCRFGSAPNAKKTKALLRQNNAGGGPSLRIGHYGACY